MDTLVATGNAIGGLFALIWDFIKSIGEAFWFAFRPTTTSSTIAFIMVVVFLVISFLVRKKEGFFKTFFTLMIVAALGWLAFAIHWIVGIIYCVFILLVIMSAIK